MKAKLKLDKNAIKNFFIDHAEKVVFGFVLLGVVFIIYSAVSGREKTDKNPTELVAKVTAAKSTIEQARIVETKAAEIDKIAEMSQKRIDESPYQQVKSISPPLGKSEQSRGEPPVLSVEKLAVETGMGMFQIALAPPKAGETATAAAAAGADQRGQRWAVLTGLVPIRKQCEAYADTFRDCKQLDPVKDAMPDYKGYWVERLEVASPADSKNPDWSDKNKVAKFQSNTVENEVRKDWGASMQLEPVESRYLHPNLSFPLGPLVDGAWDAKVAHEPEIPVLSANGYPGMGAPTPEATAADKKPAEAAGAFDDRTAAPGQLPAQGGMPGGGRGGYGPMMGGYGPPMAGGHGMVEGEGGRYGPRGMAPMGMAPGLASMDPNAVEYVLFRFFDFTVKPGKRYIYRVQLALSNPNCGAKTVYLAKPEMAKKLYLVDEKWSAPSPVVSIPNDTTTLAVAVEQPRRLIGDPLGSMLVALWQQDTGLKVYNEFAVERGQVLNFSDAEVKAVQGKPGVMPVTPDKTNLLSNVLVVDMSGGKKLPTIKPRPATTDEMDPAGKKLPTKDRAVYSPGEILIMEPDGSLVVRGEFADMDSVASYTTSPDQMVPGGMRPGRGGMIDEGMGGYGPMMGGRGGEGGYGPMRGGEGGYGPMRGGGEGMRGGYGELFGAPGGRQPTTPRKGGK